MISCIICSRNGDISQELKENIIATINCDYELVVINNSTNHYSIFSAYNEGVRKTKGDILCFMHEDILFHTNGWGNKVENLFLSNKEYGLLGVIGGQFIPKTPSSYWEGGKSIGQIIQGTTENGVYRTWLNGRLPKKEVQECVAVDGMWICIQKKMFEVIKWDVQTFKHFHCYDMDICMQVRETGKKVGVIRDIQVEHQSYGNTDNIYCEQSRLFYEKWKNELPAIAGCEMTEDEIEERTMMVSHIRGNLLLANKAIMQLEKVHHSKAYRLGKFLLKPFKLFKRK